MTQLYKVAVLFVRATFIYYSFLKNGKVLKNLKFCIFLIVKRVSFKKMME